MSAIAGIIGRVDDPANVRALEALSAAMKHRGTDASGSWISAPGAGDTGVLLTHRQSRVLDACPQPVRDGAHVLVSDGSVFSHDARALVAALRLDAPNALRRVRGTFALALWDDSRRSLLLARDALGHKPLYYARSAASGSWSLVFASELRALLACGLLGRNARLDPVGAASYLWNGFVMSPHTMVEGARSLLPGTWLAVQADSPSPQSPMFHWSMPPPMPPNEDDRTVRDELRLAVKLGMRTAPSVPMAVLLSGGIDSSSVANLAQQQRDGDAPVTSFCMAMEDESLNEAGAARAIAKSLGTEHHEVTLSEASFVASLDEAIDSLDQPTFDGLNQYHICRALRDAGFKAAAGGIGGDGIFGGDKTLRQLPRLQSIAAASAWLPDWVRVAAARAFAAAARLGRPSSPLGPQQKWAKLPDVARARGDLLTLYQLTYALFLPAFQDTLLARRPSHPLQAGLPPETHEWLAGEIAGHAAIDVAAILETRCFVGERLLRDADTVASALSFELRSPLSDPHIVDALARVPVERKFLPVGRKPILRRFGLEGVDPSLFERPKSGFVLPFDRWIQRSLGKQMERTLADPAVCAAAGLNPAAVGRLWLAYRAGAIYWTRIWAIYVLLRWCERRGVSA